MLDKNRFLATLLILSALIFPCQSVSASKNQTIFTADLGSLVFLTRERWRVHLQDVFDVPSGPDSECFNRVRSRFIQTEVLNKPIKINWENTPTARQLHRWGKVEFEAGDLGEFLLLQGWAILDPTKEVPDEYKVAQEQSRLARHGYWGECNGWAAVQSRLDRTGQRDRALSAQWAQVNVGSGGWVSAVSAIDQIELSSGINIKLQGLADKISGSEMGACRFELLKPKIEAMLLGKKVILVADEKHLEPDSGAWQRYVWLPGNRFEPQRLINQYFVELGWAELDSADLGLKYVDQMQQAETDRLSSLSPPNWWSSCFASLDTGSPVVAQKVLEFDPDCPIKGNVSGSAKNPKKTFHTPNSGWYQRLEAEACFDDELTAQAAGFIKVK